MKGEYVTGHNGITENKREREREREEICNISKGHAIIKSKN